MDNTYLQLQTDKALFPDVLFSKPERKSAAGKLAIIGGSSSGFNSVSETYLAASKTGAGSIKILFPDSLKKTLSKIWPESEFAPSNKSGGFATNALTQWLDLATWADGVIFGGDLGKSSETAVLIEHFFEQNKGLTTLYRDSLSAALESPPQLFDQTYLNIVADLSTLQKMLGIIRFPMAVRSDMSIYQLSDLLHSLSSNYPWAIITQHEQFNFCAYNGAVSATPNKKQSSLLTSGVAGSIWRLQQPEKPFAAMSSGMFSLNE